MNKIEIMVINFGCVDLMDPELIKKFKNKILRKMELKITKKTYFARFQSS